MQKENFSQHSIIFKFGLIRLKMNQNLEKIPELGLMKSRNK